MLELDVFINPEDPTIQSRTEDIAQEIQESFKPPKLYGPISQLKQIRDTYFANKMAMQLENLPVDDDTPSFQFWKYLVALEAKYKRKIPNSHELAE